MVMLLHSQNLPSSSFTFYIYFTSISFTLHLCCLLSMSQSTFNLTVALQGPRIDHVCTDVWLLILIIDIFFPYIKFKAIPVFVINCFYWDCCW